MCLFGRGAINVCMILASDIISTCISRPLNNSIIHCSNVRMKEGSGQGWFVETRVILLLFSINLNRCALCASSVHQLSRLSQRSLSAFVLAVSLVTDHAPESPLRLSRHRPCARVSTPSLSELPFHGGFYPVSMPITAIRHRCSSFCT